MSDLSLRAVLEKLVEDRDVVEPFAERMLQRLREKHPGKTITLDDVVFRVEVAVREDRDRPWAAYIEASRMLATMNK